MSAPEHRRQAPPRRPVLGLLVGLGVLAGLAVARVSLRGEHRTRTAALAAGALLVAVPTIWWLSKVI